MRKLAIYTYNNSEGNIKDYVSVCLKGIKSIVDDVLVVSNDSLNSSSKKSLEDMGITVLSEEFYTSDLSRWKMGIEYYGYEKIADYDEILLTNDSFYGPIFPFSEMWSKMNGVDCDFWEVFKHSKNQYKDDKINPIQSCWLVFRKNILVSEDFKSFWLGLSEFETCKNKVSPKKVSLSDYLEGKGFKSSSYMDSTKYKDLFTDNSLVLADSLLECGSPILERNIFSLDKFTHLERGLTHKLQKSLEFIDKKTTYDVGLIWSDLIETVPMSTLYENLNLNYILSEEHSDFEITDEKIALIMHIYPEDKIDYCYHYAQSMPEKADVYVVTSSKEKKEKISDVFKNLKNNVEYITQENRGRDNTALLISGAPVIKTYDYICFAHAKKCAQVDPFFGEDFSYQNFENLLCSKNYVKNVIKTFKNNKYLGFLTPPAVNFNPYFTIGNEFSVNYDNIKKLLSEFDVNIESKGYPKAAFGGMFWFRGKAFKTLMEKNWKFEDFPPEPIPATDGILTHAIERAIPYLVQKDGYYTGSIQNIKFSEMYMNDLYFLYRSLYIALKEKFGIHKSSVLVDKIKRIKPSKINYYKYFVLSLLTFGKTRAKILRKKENAKNKL
ncbi:MAG: rhamnan synthesis F family protein [Alphaproteobacteria bacterium]